MSDFFGVLLRRATRPPAIRPRVPSRFEADAPPAERHVPEAQPTTTPAPVPDIRVAAEPGVVVPAQRLLAEPIAPQAENAPRAKHASADRAPLPEVVEPSRARTAEGELEPARARMPSPVMAPSHERLPASRSEARVETLRVVERSERVERAERIERLIGGDREHTPEIRAERVEPRSSPGVPAPLVAARIEPRTGAPAPAPERAVEGPVVEIHIGRIEVLPLPAASPERPRREERPVQRAQSLESYLDSRKDARNRGGRA